MKSQFSVLRSKGAKIGVCVAAMASSVSAFAIDVADVTAAQTAGKTAVATTVGGLIAIVAVVIGVGIVMSLMKKA